MSNSLYRSGRVELTPAVEPRAYQPAYTSYIEETVQTVQTVYGTKTVTSPGGTQNLWAYRYVPDPNDPFNTIRELVYIGGSSNVPGSSTTIPTATEVTTFTTRVTPVYHPEVTAIAGSPARRVEYPPRGWASFARSVSAYPGAGAMAFRVKSNAIGVAVGFAAAAAPPPVSGYGHIRDGLLFTDNKIALLSNGTPLGPYAQTDTIKLVRRRNGTVAVLLNDVQITTYLSDEPEAARTAPNAMGAAMYAVGDAVFDPDFDALPGASAAMVLPAMTMFGRQGSVTQATMTLPALILTASGGSGAHMVLPAMAMFASDVRAAQMTGELPALELLAYGGTLPVVLNNGADLYLPSLIMSGVMLTGSTGGAAMALSPITLKSSDRVYGEAMMTMPPLFLTAFTEPSDEAFAFETAGFVSPGEGRTVLMVVTMDGVVVGTAAVASTLLDAIVESNAGALATATTSQLLDAIAMSFANFGASALVPGLGVDAWVWNADSKGSTSYSGYGFNSFARIGGRYFGANEGGIYALEGETDSGAPIRSVIGLGERNFGTSTKKTLVDAYIGMSAAGNLYLKVIAEGEPYIYKTRSFSDAMRQQKIDLGKGLRTNYVTLELFNEDGQDFEIDAVEFLVADLTRRI